MGLTSRKKRPLKREISHLRDASLIIIASEGEVTEKVYFESYLFESMRVQVRVLETRMGISSPTAVLPKPVHWLPKWISTLVADGRKTRGLTCTGL